MVCAGLAVVSRAARADVTAADGDRGDHEGLQREVFGGVVPTFSTPGELEAELRYWLTHSGERAARAVLARWNVAVPASVTAALSRPSGVVAPDDQVTAAEVLPEHRVQQGLARARVPHRGGEHRQHHPVLRVVVVEQDLVAAHPHVGGDVDGGVARSADPRRRGPPEATGLDLEARGAPPPVGHAPLDLARPAGFAEALDAADRALARRASVEVRCFGDQHHNQLFGWRYGDCGHRLHGALGQRDDCGRTDLCDDQHSGDR
mgnify:CR=1 FL=1